MCMATGYSRARNGPKNVRRTHPADTCIIAVAIDGTSRRECSRSRTSCINFEKCYFPELSIYFEVDGAPPSRTASR
jgi:hypothetical protein